MPCENPRPSASNARTGAAGVKSAVAGAVLALGIAGAAVSMGRAKPESPEFPGVEYRADDYGSPLVDSSRAAPERVFEAIPPQFEGVRAFSVIRNPKGAKSALVWLPQLHRAPRWSFAKDGPGVARDRAEVEEVTRIQHSTYLALKFLGSRFSVDRVGLEGEIPTPPGWRSPEDKFYRENSPVRDLSSAYCYGEAWHYRDVLGWWKETETLFEECAAPVGRLGGRSTEGYAKLLDAVSCPEVLNGVKYPDDMGPIVDALWLEQAHLGGVEKPKSWTPADDELAAKVRKRAQKYGTYARGGGGMMVKQGHFKEIGLEDYKLKTEVFNEPFRLWCEVGTPAGGPIHDDFRRACELRESKAVEFLAAEATANRGFIPFQFGSYHSFTDNVDAYNAAHPEAPLAFAAAMPVGLDLSLVHDAAVRAAFGKTIAEAAKEDP